MRKNRISFFTKKIWFWKRKLSNINPDAKIGDGTVIHSHCWIGYQVEIGKNCKIQAFVFIPPGVKLEDNVFIGPGVVFTNDKHPPSGGKSWTKTLVKKRAVIGANATILPGIKIGEGAIVGAGSVVTKNVPDGVTVVGNPARAI